MYSKFMSNRKLVHCLANIPKTNKLLNIFLSVTFQRQSEMLGPNDALILGVSIRRFYLFYLCYVLSTSIMETFSRKPLRPLLLKC